MRERVRGRDREAEGGKQNKGIPGIRQRGRRRALEGIGKRGKSLKR